MKQKGEYTVSFKNVDGVYAFTWKSEAYYTCIVEKEKFTSLSLAREFALNKLKTSTRVKLTNSKGTVLPL